MHICGIQKNGIDDLIYETEIEVENKHMDATVVKGGGGRNWEIGVDTYTLQILYIKWITSENVLYTAQKTLLNALW